MLIGFLSCTGLNNNEISELILSGIIVTVSKRERPSILGSERQLLRLFVSAIEDNFLYIIC